MLWLVDSEGELKNGGQVIKELLRNKGIDVDQFGEKTTRTLKTQEEVIFQFQPHQPLLS